MRRSQEEAAKSGWNFESNGRRTTSKPLKKLCLQGSLTEDGKDWTEELKRHCTEICDDLEEISQVHTMVDGCWRDGTGATRTVCTCPELAAELVMHARSGTSKDEACGPEDIIITES